MEIEPVVPRMYKETVKLKIIKLFIKNYVVHYVSTFTLQPVEFMIIVDIRMFC